MERYAYERGVIVFSRPLAEVHSKVGIYTEEGMVYATVYGGRSMKGSLRGSDAVFTMGRFSLQQTKGNFYKVYDVRVYENCFPLAQHLESYYVACVCAEFVRYLRSPIHRGQFKVFVETLLYLTRLAQEKNNVSRKWRAHMALCIFLWRSFFHNGWKPKFVTENELQKSKNWCFDSSVGYFRIGRDGENVSSIERRLLRAIQQSDTVSFEESVVKVCAAWNEDEKSTTKGKRATERGLKHLLAVWQELLERKLRSAFFVGMR